MEVSTRAIVAALQLEPLGPDHYVAPLVATGHPIVFGGQILAQSIAAALGDEAGKTVKTLHTVFARPAAPDRPLEVTVERRHQGRSLSSSGVAFTQGGRLCAHSAVLLSADEPDVIRHADPMAAVGSPPGGDVDDGGWQIEIVGGVDLNDPESVGPPDLDVWTRFDGAPADPGANQALLAFATDGFLIGTAMRPHAGVGQAQAHVTLSTGVLSHTLTFHEPFSAAVWLLLAHHGTYAGRGRAYGRADVFSKDGRLVASFVQDAMIRSMGERPGGPTAL